MADDDFYEDDEPVERIRALFEHGPHGLTGPPAGHNMRIDVPGTWAAEVARLTAALKVCEEALHCTAILRDDPLEPAGGDILHAAQQASGAYMTSWQPGQQERDDAGGTDA